MKLNRVWKIDILRASRFIRFPGIRLLRSMRGVKILPAGGFRLKALWWRYPVISDRHSDVKGVSYASYSLQISSARGTIV